MVHLRSVGTSTRMRMVSVVRGVCRLEGRHQEGKDLV